MTEYRSVSGIAWDDETEYFERVLENLAGTGVSFEIIADIKNFRDRLTTPNFSFTLLDIFNMHQTMHGQGLPEGLSLCVELRKRFPEMPIVLATDLFDTIRRERRESWNLGAATYLWSKALRENWFAYDLVQLLEKSGLRVVQDTLLVIGTLSDEERQDLVSQLEPVGVNPSFVPWLMAGDGWDTQAAKIQRFAAFLVIARDGESDPVALDAGRIMALPRGPERLIVACRPGQFRWLQAARIERPLGVTIDYDGTRAGHQKIINRILLTIRS